MRALVISDHQYGPASWKYIESGDEKRLSACMSGTSSGHELHAEFLLLTTICRVQQDIDVAGDQNDPTVKPVFHYHASKLDPVILRVGADRLEADPVGTLRLNPDDSLFFERRREQRTARHDDKSRHKQGRSKAANMRPRIRLGAHGRSEEHTSELQSQMRTSYAVFGLKKK